jgi:RNA polymerase sigma factor (sigma-70 family)
MQDLMEKMVALLRVRCASGEDAVAGRSLALRYIVDELRRWRPTIKQTASLEEVMEVTAALPLDALDTVRKRCLFYACDELIGLLVNKRIKGDAIAREEAMLYVQDRLQRDDFRRIDTFHADRGASFVTYMWQVINNLLLDFLRAHSSKTRRERCEVDADAAALQFAENATEEFAVDEFGKSQTQAESQVESMQLRALLAETMNDPGVASLNHPMRERLREHLHLSSKERVLLKALFQYDMSIAEICELPGFELSAGEAYRSYYRIMEQLMDAFKKAGLAETLRSLVSNVAPRVTVSINGEENQVAANRIHYLQQEGRRTACHLQWRGDTYAGVIAGSFSKIFKRLSAYFSAIDSRTALSESLLSATFREWCDSGELAIAGVERKFRFSARYLADLRARFTGKRDEKRVGSLV